MIYHITPCPAPRMTVSDKWKQRPSVMRYRAFRDEVRARGVVYEGGQSITFIMPMPSSWGKKKKLAHNMQPHTQKPDIDNLLKALFDSLYEDDAHIWHVGGLQKLWGHEGQIWIS